MSPVNRIKCTAEQPDAFQYALFTVSSDLVNNDRLRGKFCTERSISNQRVGFKGSMFKGSEVDPSFNYPYGINGLGKKREAINLSEA